MPQSRIMTRVFLIALAIALGLTVVVIAWRGKDSGSTEQAAAPAVATAPAGPLAGVAIPEFATPGPVPASGEDGTDAAAAGPQFPTPDHNAQLARLVIPKAKIDHPFVVKGLTDKREMEDPGGKDDVAWYNFSTPPGYGSNAVLSGHVDWYTGQRGVFWFLRDLKEGDEAEVRYSDGMVLTYRVVRIDVYETNDAPVAEITGPTEKDLLTMITCDGVFQRSTRDYTKRRVVTAERVG
jgi:LPXTG-site transpeptidase (sortase) family protein